MVRQRRKIPNSYSKQRYATLMVLVICFITILSINFASAFGFDNVKSYDPVTRIVTINNCDFWLGTCLNKGDVIGTARLNTPLNMKVATGYQKVGEFDLWGYQDYNDALKPIKFKNMKNNEEEIRDYDYKYLSYEEVLVDDYTLKCSDVFNEINNSYSQECERVLSGSHYETKQIWNKITPADLKKNDVLTIGIFTEVKVGDYVDWIPTIYGVEIPEWATWSESMSVDLEIYQGYNNSMVNNGDGGDVFTIKGTIQYQAGKFNQAYDVDANNNYKINDSVAFMDFGTGDFTIAFWFKIDADTNRKMFYSSTLTIYYDNNNDYIVAQDGTANYILYGSATNYDGNWHHLTYKREGTNQTLWVDGILRDQDTAGTDISMGEIEIGQASGGLEFANGIDELAVWTRAISDDEIIILQTEIWTDVPADQFPNIILNSPSSANYTTIQNIQINLTAYDDLNLTDVKLYVNDVLNQTNASGINNSNYLFNLSLADGDYTIYGKATDNESQETNSASIRIVIDTTPNIQYVSPTQIDNYNSTSSVISINVTLTETYFQNITFNVNGTEYTYTNSTRFINNSYADGSYDYNVTTCTTTGKCNITDTRTINIDAGKIVTLSYPENDTIISNDTITFLTILNSSDASEEWINITYYLWDSNGLVNNETNIISGFNLTNNVTFSNLTLKDYYWNALAWYGGISHKDYLWASDTNFTFSIGATIDNETYDNETYETDSNIFSINITLFEGVVLHAAYLYYDAVRYIGDISDLGNNKYSMNRTLDISLINGEAENRPFHWSFIYTSPVQKTQNNTIKNQTVYPIFFGLCNATYTTHALDISIKEEGTFDDLNGTLEFASEYWLGGGTITKDFTYSYLGNDTSSYDFCISPNRTFNIDDIISYTSEGYDRRDYFLDNAELSNATMNLSLYLLLTSETDIFTITVQDQDSKPVEGAFVNVQRWDIGTNNFYTVGIIKTTSDGTGIINSRLNDAWYRYQVTYNSILYLTTEPVKEAGTSRILKINLAEANPYDRFRDIDFSLTYDNITNISVFTYSDTTGAVAIGCLKVLKMEGNGTTEVYYSCVESSSGTLSYEIDDDGTYIIRAIFRLSATYGSVEQVVDEIIRQGTSIRFVTIGKFGQFISLMVVGTASMMGVAIGSIPLGLGLIAMSLIIVNLLGWLNITGSVLYGIISIIILIAINLRRGK